MMDTVWKTIKITALLLAAIFVLEVVREVATYSSYAGRLEDAYSQIEAGMTKERIRSVLPTPDWVSKDETAETWFWEAGEHQGWMLRRSGLSTVKGHYSLTIRFDHQDRVARVWAGVN